MATGRKGGQKQKTDHLTNRAEKAKQHLDGNTAVMQHHSSDSEIKPQYTLATRLGACVQYGLVSTCLTLFNRAVFKVYAFNYPNIVTTLQLLVSILLLGAFHAAEIISLEAVSIEGLHKVAPLAIFWWLYVVSGVTALRYLNVPMYSALRRSTTLLVVIGEFMFFNHLPTNKKLVALAVMVGGAIMAGLTDVTYSLPGYIWVGICCVSTATYLLLIRLLKRTTGMNQHTLLLYNNLAALPLMFGFLVLGTDELQTVWEYPRLWDPKFHGFLLLSVSQAFLLNVCIFRCTLINSPLATTVTGQVKDILTTALGMLLERDVVYQALQLIGIGLGLMGSIVYSLLSYFM